MSAPPGRTVGLETALIRAFGDCAFILISFILSIGPLARLDSRFLPLLYNRRHMGVACFLIMLVHGLVALIWYHGFGAVGIMTSLFTSQGRYDGLVGFPFQPMGFLALVIVAFLAATSHDFWNRLLGAAFWKGLHMSLYGAYALILLHSSYGAAAAPQSGFPMGLVWASLFLVAGLHGAASLQHLSAARALSDLAPHAVRGQKKEKDRTLPPSGWLDGGDPFTIKIDGARIIRRKNGEDIAVFRTEAGQFGAVAGVCPHQNGPLGEGCLKEGLITCPWHGFQYRLEDGCAPPPFQEKIAVYRLVHQDGRLYIDPTPLPLGERRALIRLEEAEHEPQ